MVFPEGVELASQLVEAVLAIVEMDLVLVVGLVFHLLVTRMFMVRPLAL
jgi:hypothetical protein